MDNNPNSPPADLFKDESQPLDPSIPEGWEKHSIEDAEGPVTGLRPDKPDREGDWTCESYRALRVLRGPIRRGRCMPHGRKKLLAFYIGACKWDIYLVQPGFAREYQLTETVIVKVLICRNAAQKVVTSEHIVSRLPAFWKHLKTVQTLCTQTKVSKQPVEGRPELADCPERDWDPIKYGGLPASVRQAMKDQADSSGTEPPEILDFPVSVPDPPKPPEGPTIGPAPGPMEEARRKALAHDREALLGHGGAHSPHRPEDEITPEEREWEKLLERMKELDELEKELIE